MKHTSEIWPPPPTWPQPEADTNDDDWLTANDFLREVTWRDYAIVYFAALWLLLACAAIACHHHLPAGVVKSVHHIVRTVLP